MTVDVGRSFKRMYIMASLTCCLLASLVRRPLSVLFSVLKKDLSILTAGRMFSSKQSLYENRSVLTAIALIAQLVPDGFGFHMCCKLYRGEEKKSYLSG